MLLFLIRPHDLAAVTRGFRMAVCALALGLSGCAQSPLPSMSTPLPDLKPPAAIDSLLTPSQKQKAIDDIAAKKTEAEAAAVKQIEKSR